MVCVCVCVCVWRGSTSRALSACRCALIVAPDAGSMSEMSRSTVPALTQAFRNVVGWYGCVIVVSTAICATP